MHGLTKDLTGRKFGRVLVLKYLDKRKHHPSGGWSLLWLCRCSCGKEFETSGSSLLGGNTKSCGCLRWKMGPILCYYNRYVRSAKKKNIEFSLSVCSFERLVRRACAYCGKVPDRCPLKSKNYQKTFLGGIDRIDTTKGYISGNCAPCCWRCNRAKAGMTVNEFFRWVSSVYRKMS
jgi:hypothetical protein